MNKSILSVLLGTSLLASVATASVAVEDGRDLGFEQPSNNYSNQFLADDESQALVEAVIGSIETYQQERSCQDDLALAMALSASEADISFENDLSLAIGLSLSLEEQKFQEDLELAIALSKSMQNEDLNTIKIKRIPQLPIKTVVEERVEPIKVKRIPQLPRIEILPYTEVKKTNLLEQIRTFKKDNLNTVEAPSKAVAANPLLDSIRAFNKAKLKKVTKVEKPVEETKTFNLDVLENAKRMLATQHSEIEASETEDSQEFKDYTQAEIEEMQRNEKRVEEFKKQEFERKKAESTGTSNKINEYERTVEYGGFMPKADNLTDALAQLRAYNYGDEEDSEEEESFEDF